MIESADLDCCLMAGLLLFPLTRLLTCRSFEQIVLAGLSIADSMAVTYRNERLAVPVARHPKPGIPKRACGTATGWNCRESPKGRPSLGRFGPTNPLNLVNTRLPRSCGAGLRNAPGVQTNAHLHRVIGAKRSARLAGRSR